MEEIKQEKQKMRTSTKWAIAVTVVWLGGVAAYVFFKWDKFLSMDPNAIGDFLAGTMSPLALFWLVAGYRQQGEELQLNTKALEAQLTELSLYVRSNQIIADSSKRQVDISEQAHHFHRSEFEENKKYLEDLRRREIKPELTARILKKSNGSWDIEIKNNGRGFAKDLKIVTYNFESLVFNFVGTHVNSGAIATFRLDGQKPSISEPFFSIECKDEDDHLFNFGFDFDEASFALIRTI
ncbi:hypothetical protein [Cellvibrio sp. UBA7671]|uniref:hypothetical protein n=1 Tax=Cellvibrio sp. UBA7671 TaxID=1946312 RepID=UPI002F34F102